MEILKKTSESIAKHSLEVINRIDPQKVNLMNIFPRDLIFVRLEKGRKGGTRKRARGLTHTPGLYPST